MTRLRTFWPYSRKRLLTQYHFRRRGLYAAQQQGHLMTCGRHVPLLLHSSLRTKNQLLLRGCPITPRRSMKRLGRLATTSTSSHFEKIDLSCLVEEEILSSYNPKHYYPVKLGEVLYKRYKIIGKLGFGSASTVWLCRDLQKQHEYIVLKVYINCSKYHREVPIYEEINNLQTAHEGRKYVRKMYDSLSFGDHMEHTSVSFTNRSA